MPKRGLLPSGQYLRPSRGGRKHASTALAPAHRALTGRSGSKSTLVALRKRLIGHEMDRPLVERTVEVAARRRSFGHKALRAALDSSPLWGAGRVEETYNLLGEALKKTLGVIASQQGRGLA